MLPDNMYQGPPCKRGHAGLRYKSNDTCVECNREAAARHNAKRKKKGYPPSATYKGAPCINGHDGTRYVSNRKCVECVRHRARMRYIDNPTPVKQVGPRRPVKTKRLQACLDFHKLWATASGM